MNELTALANKYVVDKGTVIPNDGRHHGPRLGFTEVYYDFFKRLKDHSITILEIGIGSGNSLKMWYDFFPRAKVFGIDIADASHLNNDRITTIIADQSCRESLRHALDLISRPIDIVIDDGSHVCAHQQISLGFLFKYLAHKGQYWVEDLHTSDITVWYPGVKLYGYDMGGNIGNQNTVNVFEMFGNCGKFESTFLTDKENKYLSDNIADYQMFDLGETMYGKNKLALFSRD